MRPGDRAAAFIALALSLVSCSESGPVHPEVRVAPRYAELDLPPVHISELHYDNTGTDTGEAIEVNGAAGTDLSGWSLALYNGSPTVRSVYSTIALSGVIPASCEGRGVRVFAAVGMQNGDPDGVALVNGSTVVEFLSYGGSFVAANGPAAGLSSTDIGVKEPGAVGESLQRDLAGNWSGPIAATFGVCNALAPVGPIATVVVSPSMATVVPTATQQFTAAAFDAEGRAVNGASFTWSSNAPAIADVDDTGLASAFQSGDATLTATAPNGVSGTATLQVKATPPLPEVRFSEIHYDNTGADRGEAIEVEGPAGFDLTGWSVVLYNGNGGAAYDTKQFNGTIPGGCDGRGVMVINYPADGIQNGSPDGFALVDPAGTIIEFLSYEGSFTATNGSAVGLAAIDIGVAESSSTPAGQSLGRNGDGAWQPASPASFGACNEVDVPPPTLPNFITFSGRTASDPPLPVGFEDQVFATLRDGSGNAISSTFTWSAETPEVASIDQNGVFRALAAGTAILRATAADGTTGTYSLPTRIGVASATAQYEGNAEFGEPVDADASDDFIVRRAQYTASYNRNRGTPNWVSFNLEATHFGAEDRCDCFTFDPALPANFTRITTADYTGAGAFAGFSIDRGHLLRSFDRTSASLDNATTYYFTNIIPQAADQNQGPWAALENFLGNLAQAQNKEVYVVTGVAGNKGTIKNEGRIVIPASVWKVAVVLPRNQRLANIDDHQDFELIAVNMPNDRGVRSVPWETYKTTVDAIEVLSGYDLLALLPDPIEIAAESGTQPPIGSLDGPYASSEGATVSMSAAASSDPDGDVLTYEWSFGDGQSAAGSTVSHTFAQDGVYTVRLIVTDPLGLADTVTTTATVSNVAPAIAAFDGATLLPHETYSPTGAFADPGADRWSATVDYGDGTGVHALALNGQSFWLSHKYTTPGSFAVTVRISDDDATSARTQVVTVLTAAQVVHNVIALVEQLVAEGKLTPATGKSLEAVLSAVGRQLERGHATLTGNQLQGFLKHLDAVARTGRITQEHADMIRGLIERVVRSSQSS